MTLALRSSARTLRGRAGAGRVGVALAAVTFAIGLALGVVIAPDIGRQVRANPAPASMPVAPAAPSIARSSTTRGAHAAEVLRVIDGDTFEARVRVWPGIEITTRVRLRDIDAPELGSAKCAEERAKAEVARDALRQLLAEGDVTVTRVDFDKYGGRVLAAAATRATPDISAAMLAKGLARPYAGGRRDGWCPGSVGSNQ
jgi:endonuclease YncB( thermonuclease family)